MKKNTLSTSDVVAIGAGAVALAASSYYFFGPLGKIHRKKAVGWMIKMKGEVVERIEQEAKEITEETYHSIVDSVLAAYVSAGKIDASQLQSFADDLKKHWKPMIKTLRKRAGKITRSKKTKRH